MSAKKYQKIIKEKLGKEEWSELLYEGEFLTLDDLVQLKEKTGLDFRFIESYRDIGSGDYDVMVWIFSIDNKLYKVSGYYSSWDGTEIEDLFEWEPVKKEIQVVTVYTSRDEK